MGAESSEIQSDLVFLLKTWARAGNHGRVFEAECSYRCFPDNARRVRKPDVSFVRRGRLPDDRAPRASIRVPPDFMVEVVSPNEKVYDLNRKLTDFLGVGVPLIWVVNPDLRSVRVHRPGAPSEEFAGDHILTGDPVLPGFSVKVVDLFPPAPAPAPLG